MPGLPQAWDPLPAVPIGKVPLAPLFNACLNARAAHTPPPPSVCPSLPLRGKVRCHFCHTCLRYIAAHLCTHAYVFFEANCRLHGTLNLFLHICIYGVTMSSPDIFLLNNIYLLIYQRQYEGKWKLVWGECCGLGARQQTSGPSVHGSPTTASSGSPEEYSRMAQVIHITWCDICFLPMHLLLRSVLLFVY